MAKISRRAVASSLPASSISAAASSSSSISSSSQGNPNNIQNGGKPTRSSTHSAEQTGKHSSNEGSSTITITTTYPDPLRLGSSGHQFTTRSISQTETPTLGASSAPQFSTARPTPATLSSSSATPLYNATAIEAERQRQRIREEFFATYDVMTGVRIAATLGGFFGLMVFLIVWKSRSSSNETMKVLKDPKMAAVAAVCMQEEEERKIQEAMVATGMSIYPDEYDAILYRRQRMLSLGNVSAPPVLHRNYRFSSVGGGGYSSLLEPPRRFSYSYGGNSGSSLHIGSVGGSGRRKSGSETSRILSNYPMGSSFGMDDFFMETDDEVENGAYPDNDQEQESHHKRSDSTKGAHGFLEVPQAGCDSRRSSAMTCCSTESSYLERRCSAFTLGLGNLPPSLQRKLSTTSRTSSTDLWDYYYPDIQVIQPTPKASPCPSERSIYEQLKPGSTVANAATRTSTKTTITATTVSNIIPTTATATTTITSKTAKPTKAANGGNGASTTQQPPKFVRKHSIAYYDPESAQAGRKQQIHSISADTVDFFPYNQAAEAISTSGITYDNGAYSKVMLGAGGGGNIQQRFQYNDSPTEELRLNVRQKIAVVELQGTSCPDYTPTTTFENNNSFPYNNSAAAIAAAAAAVANSSSLSIDSTPASLDKLNGSGSLGICGNEKNFFDAEKRAPLASLSSFKISSLEYQDSELRSLDEDSVFLNSVADTDEDMQQFSSESEEASLSEQDVEGALNNESAAAVEQPPVIVRTNETQRYAVEKRYSLGACTLSVGGAQLMTNRARRPLLQRHRTISASSSDRISLIGQQLKEFPSGHYLSCGSGTATPTTIQPAPLETHFGTIISTSSPPTHPRRAQLLQQYSDPQSLPTHTTTEDDTCSTLNTEVCAVATMLSPGTTSDVQQISSSISRCSPPQLETHPASSSSVAVSGKAGSSQSITKYQLPRSRLADDTCASSISDSVINTSRQPIICVPSSLKNLILRGSSGSQAEKLVAPTTTTLSAKTLGYAINKSATNLSMLETADGTEECQTCPSVMLELPLIKLPTDESSDSSTASVDIERSRSASDESRDPSLPGSSRKWSKETLF